MKKFLLTYIGEEHDQVMDEAILKVFCPEMELSKRTEHVYEVVSTSHEVPRQLLGLSKVWKIDQHVGT